MSLHRGPMAFALILVVWLSGCAGLPTDDKGAPTIALPFLRFGDEWTLAFLDGARVSGSYTTRVGARAEAMLDQYGVPMEAVVVERDYGHGVTMAWIETAGGHWLATEGGAYQRDEHCSYPITPTSSGSVSRRVAETSLWHASTAVPAAFGEVWGKTIGSAVLRETGHSGLGHGQAFVTVVHEYKVLGRATITPLIGAGHPFDTVVVQMTSAGAGVIEGQSQNWKSQAQLFLHEGFPVPLRIQVVDDDTVRVVSELQTYKPGGKRIPFGDETMLPSFSPQSPYAQFTRTLRTPATGELKLEFPFDAALAAARKDPRAAPAAAWLLQHPNAWSPQASYSRDPARGVYDWDIALREGQEQVRITAQRRTNLPGLADSASATLPSSSVGYAGMAPVRPMADLGSSLLVAQAFDEDLNPWRRLSWTLRSAGHGGYGGHLEYGFAAATTRTQPGPGPLVETEVVEYHFGPSIDGATGGVRPGSMWPLMCQSSLAARPPI